MLKIRFLVPLLGILMLNLGSMEVGYAAGGRKTPVRSTTRKNPPARTASKKSLPRNDQDQVDQQDQQPPAKKQALGNRLMHADDDDVDGVNVGESGLANQENADADEPINKSDDDGSESPNNGSDDEADNDGSESTNADDGKTSVWPKGQGIVRPRDAADPVDADADTDTAADADTAAVAAAAAVPPRHRRRINTIDYDVRNVRGTVGGVCNAVFDGVRVLERCANALFELFRQPRTIHRRGVPQNRVVDARQLPNRLPTNVLPNVFPNGGATGGGSGSTFQN